MRRLQIASLIAVLLGTFAAHGAGRELAPREYGPTPYYPTQPTIAHAGGKFLTVWREHRRLYGYYVLGAFSDAAGRPLGPSFVILRDAPTSLKLVSTGDAFVLVNGESELVEIDLSGRVTRGFARIPLSGFLRDIEWNGTHFLAVGQANSAGADALAVLFTRTGTVVRRHIPLTSIWSTAEIVVDGKDFVVLIPSRDGLFANRVTSDGSVTRALIEEGHAHISGAYRPSQAVGVARGDGTIVAVWDGSDWRSATRKAAVIGPDGTPREVRTIATFATTLPSAPLFVMRAGDGYVVAFRQRQTDGTELVSVIRLDASGTLVSATEPVPLGSNEAEVGVGDGVAGLVYTRPPGARPAILQRVVDANGALSDEQHVSIARARQTQPALGVGGGQFLAAFTEIGASVRTRAAAVAPDGEPLGSRYTADALMASKELAWSGNAYLTILQRERTLFAQRLTFEGEPLGEPVSIVELEEFDERPAAVVWSVDRWFVVWLEFEAAYFATVSPAGIVSRAEKLPLDAARPANWRRTFYAVSLAADGPRVLVSWIEAQQGPLAMPPYGLSGFKAFAQRFRRDGRPIDAAPLLLAERTRFLSSTTGRDFVVVTDAPEQTTMIAIDPDGALRVASRETLPAGVSDVTWDGSEYVVAARYWSDHPQHLVVARFDERLERVRPPRAVMTLAADEQAQPSVAAVMGEVVVAIQEGTPAEGAGAVVYRERDMTELPPPPTRRRAIR